MSENMNDFGAVRKENKALRKLIAVTVAMLLVAALAAGAFFVFNNRVQSEYKQLKQEIAAQNETDKAQFDAQMAQKRSAAAGQESKSDVQAPVDQNLESWTGELENKSWMIQDQGSAGLENTSTIELSRAEALTGGLLLVNAWHELPADFSTEALVSVGLVKEYGIPVADSSVQLFDNAARALSETLTAAKAEGLEHYIVREGFRSVKAQTDLFDEKMKKLAEKYSGNRLIAETKKAVNYPGTSDYHSGLSFRMDLWEKNNPELNKLKFQAESKQGEWLTENCWKYGIIFRFPTQDFPNEKWEDKSYKTGVSSQINLYRYVGKPHAAVMRVMGMCLEEYLEFLQKHPHICVYQNGALLYEIVRMNVSDDAQSYSAPVPNPASSYIASLDNLGGMIMAYTY